MSGPQPVIEPQRYLRETNQSYAFPSFRKFIHDSDDEEKEKEKEEGGGGGEKVVQTDGLLTRRVRTAEEKVRRSHDDDDNDDDDELDITAQLSIMYSCRTRTLFTQPYLCCSLHVVVLDLEEHWQVMIPWNVPASIMCLFMHSYSCVHQDKDEEDYVEWLKGQTDVEGAEELQDMVSVCV